MLNKEECKYFKIGDYVVLIDPAGIFTLEINKSYKIINTTRNYKGEQMIALEDVQDEDSPLGQFFNSRRFTKDIKIIRKDKLKKLQQIYETNQ